jgi:hypothetical protein
VKKRKRGKRGRNFQATYPTPKGKSVHGQSDESSEHKGRKKNSVTGLERGANTGLRGKMIFLFF